MNSQKYFISLDSLVELSNKLNSSRNIHFILNTVVLSLMGKLGFRRGGAFIVNCNGEVIEELIVKGNLGYNLLNNFWAEFSSLNFFDNKYLVSSNDKALMILIKKPDENYYLLIFGSRVKKNELSDEELHYLTLVLNMTVNALEMAYNYESIYKTNIELGKRNQLLSTLFEISKDFSFSLTLEQIINYLRYRILGQLLVNKFALFYLENGHYNELISTLEDGFANDDLDALFSFEKITFVDDISNLLSNRLSKKLSLKQVKVISPLKYQSSTRGVLLLGKKYNNQPFTNEDLNFIEAFGNIVILSIEHTRLIQEEIKKKQLEKELQLAFEIQKNLLPKEIPAIKNADVYGITIPSKVVGGDYFDIISISNSNVYLAIADVSGKGIPASLLMANVQSALHLLVKLDLSLDEIINKINYIIFRNTNAENFITFFLGKLNTSTLEFTFVNAGQNPPILYRKESDEFIYLSDGCLFLGFLDSPLDIKVGNVKFVKGDLLFLYTDGIVECENADGNEFGSEKLKIFIRNNCTRSAKEISNLLLEELVSFCGSKEFKDDVSFIVLSLK